jgi:hypothetical protein
MNVLVLQKRMSLSNVKLPNIDQIDCQFICVFLLTDEKNYLIDSIDGRLFFRNYKVPLSGKKIFFFVDFKQSYLMF